MPLPSALRCSKASNLLVSNSSVTVQLLVGNSSVTVQLLVGNSSVTVQLLTQMLLCWVFIMPTPAKSPHGSLSLPFLLSL